ncbi:MAG: DUF4012 domain-containing protein [Dehalococcoidia bacterium]
MAASDLPARRAAARTHRRRLALMVGVAIVAASGAYVAFTCVRLVLVYRDVAAAKAELLEAEALLRSEGLDASDESLAAAETGLLAACADFRSAERFLAREPLLRVAGRVPLLAPQAGAAREMTAIGCEGSEIGLATVESLRALNEARESGAAAPGESALAVLDALAPQIDTAERSLSEMRESRAAIGSAWLLPPLSGLAGQLDARIEDIGRSLERARDGRTVAAELLAAEGERSYLLLALDNTELSGGGGLVGVYGEVTLDRGHVVSREFGTPADLTERWQERSGSEYVEPPAPLKRYLLRDHTWSLGVAAWSPHFPETARRALDFHERSGAPPVDGVIAIDYTALEALLDVLGPTEVEGYDVVVDGDGVVEEVLARITTEQRPGDRPNAFGVAVAAAVVDAALTADGDLLRPLAETLQRLAEARHLFVYSRDGAVEDAVEGLGWAGELKDPPGDYLMAVNASVHSTKLNLALEERMELSVRLRPDGSAVSTLTLRYENGLDGWATGRDPEMVSQLMLGGFYGAYLRLLAPPGARLLDVRLDGESVGAEEVGSESGKASVGRYVPLPRGARATLQFVYEAPVVAEDGEYRLYVQKQPGSGDTPLAVRLQLPPGERADYVSLNGETLTGKPLYFETELSRDQQLVVRY